MSHITVGVINPAETEKVTVKIPDDVEMEQLVPALVSSMGMPIFSTVGDALVYHLSRREEDGSLTRLNKKETLADAGVESGNVLQLTVEMVAGGGTKDSALFMSPSSLSERKFW